MRTREEVLSIVRELCADLRRLFSGEIMDVILFTGTARQPARCVTRSAGQLIVEQKM